MTYGPWAVICGASEGIGAAFARQLAASGVSLVLIARRTEPLDALAEELRASTLVKVETVALDLAAADLAAHFRAIADAHEVGLVIYNAALSSCAPFLDIPLEDKLRAIAVNAAGPVIAAHVFGERMRARKRGGIILMSSLTAFWGSAFLATYGATKAFNLSLGEALATELRESGVDVLVSCAGATRTPGFLRQISGQKGPASMSPESVARETLKALPKRGAFVPGFLNRLAQLFMSRVLPRRVAIVLMASETRKLLPPR